MRSSGHPAQLLHGLGGPIQLSTNADWLDRAGVLAGIEPSGLLCQIGIEAKLLGSQIWLGDLLQRWEVLPNGLACRRDLRFVCAWHGSPFRSLDWLLEVN